MGYSKTKRPILAPSLSGYGGAPMYAEVSITSARVKTLRANPFTLVPAPGAGKMAVLQQLILIAKYGGNSAWTVASTSLAAKYTNGSGQALTATIVSAGLMDQSADTVAIAPDAAVAATGATGAVNQAIVLHNTGAAEFAGNADADNVLKVKIVYQVVSNL